MIKPHTYTGLFLFSVATLAFEINLTRLFSVAQFYHFAFMIVSLALLGFGASGTALAAYPNLRRGSPEHRLGGLALAGALSMLGTYLLTNGLPFDSFSIAWDARQGAILALHYLALASPFFFNGLAVGLLLSAHPQGVGQTYAVNLLGAALGCVVALATPSRLGAEGTVVLSSGLAALAALIAFRGRRLSSLSRSRKGSNDFSRSAKTATKVATTRRAEQSALLLLLFCFFDLGARLFGLPPFAFLELRLSPYKSLSYALQYPGAQLIFQQWNAVSRVDVVDSPGVRSLPGLSYRYLQPPPPELGLLVDGDDLSPVVLPGADTSFADYLPSAIVFHVRPQADVLILEPRGGLDVLTALALGANRVTAVESNRLIVQAAGEIYDGPRVRVVNETGRSYLRRADDRFDVIVLSLTSSYHPVRSGAYSLAEDYRYTVEAFRDVLARLNPGGVLVVSRWLQMPPSECVRAFALAVTALEETRNEPAPRIAAFRGYNMMTLLVKNDPFTADELDSIRAFAASRAFDLVYAPGIREEETNHYNILPESIYYQTFTGLINARPRSEWYAAYEFDVTPPTDDRPFFGHFFKWSQAGQVMAELGKTWQPFGGAGYFVLVALLIMAAALSALLIVIPLAVAKGKPNSQQQHSERSLAQSAGRKPALSLSKGRRAPGRTLFYFGLIGVGFLLVEIPLMQRFILFLGQPAYALTAVLFSLFLFSGLGSQLSARMPQRIALVLLVVAVAGTTAALPRLFALTLHFPLWLRLAETALVLAPLGLLMGMPFPCGIRWLSENQANTEEVIAWAWAVNGAASVVSAVLAALLSLSFGFSAVLMIGTLCYAGAWLMRGD